MHGDRTKGFQHLQKKYKPLNLSTSLQVMVGEQTRNVSSFFSCMRESWSSEQQLTSTPSSIIRSLFEPDFFNLTGNREQFINSPEKDKHIILFRVLLHYNTV